jgi:hypothetical protein
MSERGGVRAPGWLVIPTVLLGTLLTGVAIRWLILAALR